MTRHACRRCDWQPEGPGGRAQLAEHATEAGHPLCVICALSLDRPEIQTCLECLGQVRRDLHRVVDLYATLPDELGHATAAPIDAQGGSHSDEQPIPGGEVLPLLAGGSRGLTQVRGVLMPDGQRDYSHEADERPGDPPSVAFELSRAEDDWRIARGEPAATVPPTVTSASGYLHKRLSWAAAHHGVFDQFAAEVRSLLYRLERVTANDDRPEIGAPCFECGADLRREWTRTGLADDWKCPRCRQVYPDAAYWLAVRAELEKERDRQAEAKRAAREGAA